ncbi:unnamed protein product [Mesocestoides corti]|uniref:C-type lectin domain-containing protein n=1 Tax=Mesocestoides corti TaxID=53468 RepID=A0A0R3UHC6_MESCO|nr:unnamed protein product [Mesocestoides corti]
MAGVYEAEQPALLCKNLQSMKFILALVASLALLELVSSYTFIVSVETDEESGRPFITYDGTKYYLSDDERCNRAVFVRGDCVVSLYLGKSDPSGHRWGDAICKGRANPMDDDFWKTYVEERLNAAPGYSRSECA